MTNQTNNTQTAQNGAQAQTAPQISKHELIIKRGTFIGSKGNAIKYVTLYVNIAGVDVKLIPADDTGKRLVAVAFGGGE